MALDLHGVILAEPLPAAMVLLRGLSPGRDYYVISLFWTDIEGGTRMCHEMPVACCRRLRDAEQSIRVIHEQEMLAYLDANYEVREVT